MRLISLSANKESFKTVHFKNETGVNLIVATQKDPGKSDKGDTTNGVGKSLLIAIIHFCLGANGKRSFNKALSGWAFELEFKIDGLTYTSIRSTNDPKKIYLNGKQLKLKDFKDELEELVFDIPQNTKELSFRSLLSFFLRPRKSSYVDELNPNDVNKDYQVQLINAFLLGLEISLAEEKNNLKTEKDRIRKLVKNIKEDDLIQDCFSGNKDITLAKSELDDTITKLEKDLETFEVAEDYYDIKKEADTLQKSLTDLQNKISFKEAQIRNIDESLELSPDIKKENIEKIYDEASVILKNEVTKRLSELETFYEQLSINRRNRLSKQKTILKREISHLEKENSKKGKALDKKLKYLDAHHALDVFVKLTGKLSDARTQRNGIDRFENLLEEYNEEKRTIQTRLIDESKSTDEYLKELDFPESEINTFFREIIKKFYPDVASSLTVYNNDNENKIRYDIDAKIQDDKSDGISKIKLFTYDLTLLLKGFNHKIDFLFHDSRLLDGVDPRQKADLFRILNEYIKANGKQYILTANFNQLEELKDYLTLDEYAKIVDNNIILELKDASDEEKLLGIQIDLDY